MGGMDELLTHLVFLARHLRGLDKRHIVEIFLMEIGTSTNANGFNYLVDSILIYGSAFDPLISKDVYPDVAKRHTGSNAARIEQAVRRTIIQTWRERTDKWTMYFANERRPANGEFISRLAKMLELWEDCCKALTREEGSDAEFGRNE